MSARPGFWATGILSALFGLTVQMQARAQTQPEIAVYASSTGSFEGELKMQQDYQAFELYIDKLGTTPSTAACDETDGDGDELCGYDVIITMAGPGFIDDFVPDSAFFAANKIQFYPDAFPLSPGQGLRVNFVDAAPVDAQEVHIGTLTIDAVGFAATTTVPATGSSAVTANLDLAAISDQPILVPEASGNVLLISGIFGLALIYRLHRYRHRRQRASEA